jgi:hypothetical protein
VEDIPEVIEAARAANLVNVGGQLQFRLPDGGTCECYWVEVDASKAIKDGLSWPERVTETAAIALSQLQKLRETYDFVAEGRSAFKDHLNEFEARGGNIDDALCFVWYLEAATDAEHRMVL